MKKSNPFIYAVILWAIVVVCVLVYMNRGMPKTTGTISASYEFDSPNVEEIIEVESEDEDEFQIETENAIKTEPITEPETTPFFKITDSDRYTIECIVAGESKGESLRGKKLVAQCIMNAMIHNNWDAETVRVQYKYAGWDSELENTNPELWEEIEFAVSEVFDKGNLETYEPILYFYAPKWSSGSWHENNLEYVLTEGGHKFFKLRGE